LTLGLSKEDALAYFTGPAHFPWNRMGNITGWDGPFPEGYLEKQLALAHQVQHRMRELGMTPIAPCFAGFVPETIKKIFPRAKTTKVYWGGFSQQYASNILLPDDPAFARIGSLFLKEYEQEFGRGEFYLADNFNEMAVPHAPGETEDALLAKLANYGNAVYQAIRSVNADAIWVMQGWTFPYNGDFWTYPRLNALVSRVPDDKLLILDLANEYNHDFWKIPPSWVTYKGFMHKMWIYSFIPNMGGKTVWNGILDTYAGQPSVALQYAQKGNLVGYGFAPEGIENNDLIYELLSDIGYTDRKIDLDAYLARYCVDRYGAYPGNMKKAFDCFRKSCYGTFTDHPRFGFQHSYTGQGTSSVNADSNFREGVRLFLSCRDSLDTSPLYTADAIELTAQYAGFFADGQLRQALATGDSSTLASALGLLQDVDRLLRSHPTQRLDRWVQWARNWGTDDQEKDYYESNAKRLISNWGGGIGDYAARMWSGMIGTYYAGRIKAYAAAKQQGVKFDIGAWTDRWIHTPYRDSVPAFEHPLEKAAELVSRYP
jgi:alpha-N-acetylglucosaminidase